MHLIYMQLISRRYEIQCINLMIIYDIMILMCNIWIYNFWMYIWVILLYMYRCLLVSADYSQMEMRVLAHICNDTAMIALFRQDKDIYRSLVHNLLITCLYRLQITDIYLYIINIHIRY